jgi:hypothetical protein
MKEKSSWRKFQDFIYQQNINVVKSYTLAEYDNFMDSFKKEFGEEKEQWFMDCWMPEGEAIQAGIEDSCSHYSFVYPSKKEFNSSF